MSPIGDREDIGMPTSPAARKARKRELDRISQRLKTKHDRDTISRLKTQVQALKQQTDHTHVYNLVLKQEEGQDRIKRHLERVKQIEALVQADLNDLGVDNGDDSASATITAGNPVVQRQRAQRDNNNHQNNVANHRWSSTEFCATSTPQPLVAHLDGMAWNEPAHDLHTASPLISNHGSPNASFGLEVSTFDESPPEPLGIPELPTSLDTENDPHWALQGVSSIGVSLQDPQRFKCESMWTICDAAVTQGREQFLYASDSQPYVESDADIIVTAIVQGWHKASKSRWWNAQWEALRQIDQFCHFMCGPVERMSSLLTLIHLFKYQRFLGDPLASELPRYLHPRPSQFNISHPAVVDHFIWPGMREHLVFNHKKYCNNIFSTDYGNGFRFLWPFELRDAYLKNRETGFYQFSADFINRTNDLRCYTMKADFLAKYPEFQGDIPIFEPAPRKGKLGGVGFWHFPLGTGQLEGIERNKLERMEEGRKITAGHLDPNPVASRKGEVEES